MLWLPHSTTREHHQKGFYVMLKKFTNGCCSAAVFFIFVCKYSVVLPAKCLTSNDFLIYSTYIMYIYVGFTTFASIMVTCKLFHKYIRPRFSVKVNCWFCLKNHVVPYGNVNCWDCPFCDQYNGFNVDGDYNKVIPSQHENLLNTGGNIDATKLGNLKTENGLCEKCNRNQLLKIKQLAAFVPCNQNAFDVEIEDFQNHLESVYKLCRPCEEVLNCKLASQNESLRSKILSWRLKKKNKNPMSIKRNVFNGRELCIKLLHCLSWAIAFALTLQAAVSFCKDAKIKLFNLDAILSNNFVSFLSLLARHNYVIIGLFSILFSVLLSGKHRLRCIDAISCFAWLVTLFSSLPIFALESVTTVAMNGMLSGICLLVTSACRVLKYPLRCEADTSLNGSTLDCSFVPNSSRFSDCSQAEHNSVSSRVTDQSFLRSDIVRRSLLQDSCITTTSPSSNAAKDGGHSVNAPIFGNKDFDLDNDLQAMKIGTPQKHPSLSNIFATKSYDSPSSFPPPSSPCSVRRQILTPPHFKAKSLNKSSWVAGGYWASAPSGPYGSHSSESFLDRRSMWQFPRSSIGSRHLNCFYGSLSTSVSCPVSREGSTSGDDRLSVFSEPSTLKHRPLFSLSPSSLATIRDLSPGRESWVQRESVSGDSDVDEPTANCNDKLDANRRDTNEDVTATSAEKALAVSTKGSTFRNVVLFSILGISLIANSVLVCYLFRQYLVSVR